ncbi:hypothetical protein ACRALDRAFT_2120224 [Sodiomyces alcalophilus JCM 7366]|uniref:uncharacterized protein n=2 Tax=Sodiomyces alcalophilus JCM 7366 TaxID=591952 RepID=UPI0039B426C4
MSGVHSKKRRKLSHGSSAPDESPTESRKSSPSLPAKAPEPETQESQDEPQVTFADLGLAEPLLESTAALGYERPTPIQAKSIPEALKGRDIIGLAETGSGKTAAFALPIIQALLEKPSGLFAVVLAPTRELAGQIAQNMEALGSICALRCATIVGGLDMVPQAIALSKKPHVIVATPGRLLDHLEKTRGFNLRSLKYLVMDEADRLLDLDFGPSIDRILKFVPRERKTYLFSATMSSKVESLQRASLKDPVRISVNTGASKHQVVASLIQNYLFIPHSYKDVYTIYLINEHAGQTTIIFTRTVNECQRLGILLRTLGFGAIPLHGQLSQSARMGALNKFKAGSRQILVATDVAARGLDIPNVDVVLNYDLPQDSKTYIHRVGRTARAGKSGLALSLVTQYDLEIWLRIEAALGKKLKEYPTEKDQVMVFQPRVEEAQRHARIEMKNIHESRDRKGGIRGKAGRPKRRHDNMDAEEG